MYTLCIIIAEIVRTEALWRFVYFRMVEHYLGFSVFAVPGYFTRGGSLKENLHFLFYCILLIQVIIYRDLKASYI